jgi:hypothetical protein
MVKYLDFKSINRSDNLNNHFKVLNISIYDFCRHNNLDYSSVHKYLNKKLKIGDNVARRFETLLNLNENALDTGLPNEKYVTLPVVDSLSGNTEFCLDAAIKNSHESVTLERAVMTASGWEEKFLIIVKANDESMEPSIQKGAKAIVDISQNDKILVDKVYAISIFGDIFLRRITRSKLDGKLILTPDCVTFYQNNKFKIEEYTDLATIIGRVVMLRNVPFY